VPNRFVVWLIAACVACGAAAPPRVDRPDQLPVHRYPVMRDLGRLVLDDAAFAEFAGRLRGDVEHDLAAFEIRDLESLKDRLFILALLDALDGRWTESLARIDRITAVETDPAARVMTGLTIRVWADAIAHGGGPEAFRAALERKLSAVPIELVRAKLSLMRTMGQLYTPEQCRRLVDEEIRPHVENGVLSLDQAHAITFQRYTLVRLAPVGAVIDQVLGARGIEPLQ
jgi:hypothetical protein